MKEKERTAIGNGFFKLLAVAYKHGALEKYLRISNTAKAEAVKGLGMGIGDYTNMLDDLGIEVFEGYEARLAKIVPYLDILTSDVLWAATARLLDNDVIQKFIAEEGRNSITGETAENPAKDTVLSMIAEMLQTMSKNPEEKARVESMLSAAQELLWPQSKCGLKEAV